MPDPGFTRPDLCSIRAAAGQAEPAETARGGLTADGHLPAGDYPSAPLATGIDRAIRLSTAAAVLAVAGIAASPTGTPTQSSGPTARPGSPPGSSPQPSTASSTPARWWSCTRHGTGYRYPPSPAGCSRWESPLPSRRTWHRAGRTVPSGRWSRPGRRPVSWAHTNFWSGSSAPPGRQNVGRRQRTSALVRPAVLRCVLSWPQPLTASAPEGASAARQARRGGPRVRALGSRPSPPAGSVTMRRLRPAPAMTRRWPRTGSACRPATRCQNAGSPRCSGVHPAAGREPESPIHGKHRRSQTRRVPRSRLTRKQGPSAVSPERDLTAPGRSAIGAWRSATSAPLGEPGCHEGERSGLAGHPRRGLCGRSGSSARPWAWKLPSMRQTPWNLPPGTATGSSYSAPATAPSSSTAATAPAPSRCSRWTTWIRRGRAGPRRRRATRRAGVRRHLDLAHLPGARREHPQPGRPHGVAGRQEDSGRTRSTCGRSGH